MLLNRVRAYEISLSHLEMSSPEVGDRVHHTIPENSIQHMTTLAYCLEGYNYNLWLDSCSTTPK